MLEKMNEDGNWICFSFRINLMIFNLRFKNRSNGFYRQLSSGNQKLLGVSNFQWFYNAFDSGYYRSALTGTYVEYVFFLRIKDQKQSNRILKELIIRCKKLGAFKVEVGGMNTINYLDFKLLSSTNGMNAYQKVLKPKLQKTCIKMKK
jgi:hypothetical protein